MESEIVLLLVVALIPAEFDQSNSTVDRHLDDTKIHSNAKPINQNLFEHESMVQYDDVSIL